VSGRVSYLPHIGMQIALFRCSGARQAVSGRGGGSLIARPFGTRGSEVQNPATRTMISTT
jgi:hypothetical protein